MYYTGDDPNAPVRGKTEQWLWNVLNFGANKRQTQIAFCPFRYRNYMWIRQKHDDVWHGWYKLAGESPEFKILNTTTPNTATGSAFCALPDSSWNYRNTIVLKTRCLHTGNSTYYENALVCSQISGSVRLVFANPENASTFFNTKVEVYLMKIPV